MDVLKKQKIQFKSNFYETLLFLACPRHKLERKKCVFTQIYIVLVNNEQKPSCFL